MSIPTLNEHGFLPPGIQECGLEEIRRRFGSFDGTERRPRLFERLLAFITEARSAGFVRAVLVDGSFVTSKRDPNDIDLVLVLRVEHDFAADLSPDQYNVVSKRSVQRRHGFDMVAVRENTPAYDDTAAFFQQVRGRPALRKGILSVAL